MPKAVTLIKVLLLATYTYRQVKPGETSPDQTGWEVVEKQPGRKVGSESECVSKNGQEGAVTTTKQ